MIAPTVTQVPELVVLVRDDGTPCGTLPKADVHHADTPLHLAFSCWILDTDGLVLLTRRAATKPTWPLAWTNAVCGHPQPDEEIADAVRRRVRTELGLELPDLDLVLPHFRYRAEMANGVVENEVCPVYCAVVPPGTRPDPDPDEVDDWEWVSPAVLDERVAHDPDRYSPWMLLQWPDLVTGRAGGGSTRRTRRRR